MYAIPIWRYPSAWLRKQKLSHSYWMFFTAAFFFDAGFAAYFFLFNLYLLDFHFNERVIGLIGGALTLGSVVGTLPAGMLAKRIGLRWLLGICFGAASLFNALRALWMWEPAQIVLAFLAGMAMCCWGVCYLPIVARSTTEENRTTGFSLIYSVSIGTSILGGIVTGYLPLWFRAAGLSLQAVEVKRLILLAACGMALLSFLPLIYLQVPEHLPPEPDARETGSHWVRTFIGHPFLIRFLPLMALWAAILASFTPFAYVYLARELHTPLVRIGMVFSAAQAVQFGMGLLVPVVIRLLGLVHGIVVTQVAAATALFAMAMAGKGGFAIALYLIFTATQWASSPALYNLLMNETPDGRRSSAAALTLFVNALAAAVATAVAGVLFSRFGYKPVLVGIAGVALTTAMLFRIVMSPQRMRERVSTSVIGLEESEGEACQR